MTLASCMKTVNDTDAFITSDDFHVVCLTWVVQTQLTDDLKASDGKC